MFGYTVQIFHKTKKSFLLIDIIFWTEKAQFPAGVPSALEETVQIPEMADKSNFFLRKYKSKYPIGEQFRYTFRTVLAVVSLSAAIYRFSFPLYSHMQVVSK
jgi:hypothetical protein